MENPKKLANAVQQIFSIVAPEFGPCKSEAILDKSDSTVFCPKVANILLAGQTFRLITKIHYFDDELNQAALNKHIQAFNKTAKVESSDFFSETLNTVAGYLKGHLETQEIQMGLSLPLVTNGFDELFTDRPENNEWTGFWHWESEIRGVIISTSIEILSKENFESINWDIQQEDEQDCEIEFL